MQSYTRLAGLAVALAACAGTRADVFPTLPHAAMNVIPFGSTSTHHQVFASTLFSNATGGLPARITSIALAPGVNITYSADLTVRLGYTNAIPGAGAASGGLQGPVAGGGGAPNAVGDMTDFLVNPTYTATFTGAGQGNFQMVLTGTPFDYDPAQGNLLVEFVVANPVPTTLSVSRAAGSAESSRAYNITTPTASPTTALRMDFTFTPVGPSGCYPNCDESTVEPVLNVLDFNCFLNAFSAGASYANCDGSTVEPVLNVLDFNCFLNRFSAGCP